MGLASKSGHVPQRQKRELGPPVYRKIEGKIHAAGWEDRSDGKYSLNFKFTREYLDANNDVKYSDYFGDENLTDLMKLVGIVRQDAILSIKEEAGVDPTA